MDTKLDRMEGEIGAVKNAALDISKTTKDYGKRIEKLERKNSQN